MTQSNDFPADRGSDELWEDFDRTGRGAAGADVLAFGPENRDQLVELVRQVLQDKFDRRPAVDDDGDFVLRHLGQPVWITVPRRLPVVTVFSRAAHDVYSRRATEVELGILNRRHVIVKWKLIERAIWMEGAILGVPFAPAHLGMLLDQYFAVMAATRDDLAYRTGSKVA